MALRNQDRVTFPVRRARSAVAAIGVGHLTTAAIEIKIAFTGSCAWLVRHARTAAVKVALANVALAAGWGAANAVDSGILRRLAVAVDATGTKIESFACGTDPFESLQVHSRLDIRSPRSAGKTLASVIVVDSLARRANPLAPLSATTTM